LKVHQQAAAEVGCSSSWLCHSTLGKHGSRRTRIRFPRWRTGRSRKDSGESARYLSARGFDSFRHAVYDTFKVPCILLGFAGPTKNAHARDEHIALENYFGGIKPSPRSMRVG